MSEAQEGYRSLARGEQNKRAPIRDNALRSSAPTSGPRLYRRRPDSSPFNLDRRIIPEGYDYEWKCESIYGRPERVHMNELRENHWVPVPAARHPDMAEPGDSCIRLPSGEILMERPKYLSEEAHIEQIMEGLAPLQKQEEVLFGTRPGEMTRNHPSVRRSSYITEQKSPGDPVLEEAHSAMYSEP